MGIIILTSQGFSNPRVKDKFLTFVNDPQATRIAMVTTAARGKENNKWVIDAKERFEKMGFSTIDFVDIEETPQADFSKYDVVYVCGGNTFKLLHFSRIASFRQSIKDLLARNGIYIGLSASSLIMGPSVKLADEVTPDDNEVGITDFSGFNIVSQIIYPHYDPQVENALKKFESKYGVTVERLTNDQALILNDGKVERISK